jgi:hypothetical protein
MLGIKTVTKQILNRGRSEYSYDNRKGGDADKRFYWGFTGAGVSIDRTTTLIFPRLLLPQGG